MPVLEAVLDLDEELGALLRERWEADIVGVDVPRRAIPPPPCTLGPGDSLTLILHLRRRPG